MIQNSCKRGGLKQASLVCFKRGFIERGHTTSSLMLSTFEKKALAKIVLTGQCER